MSPKKGFKVERFGKTYQILTSLKGFDQVQVTRIKSLVKALNRHVVRTSKSDSLILGELLGEGLTSKVYKVQHKDDMKQIFAMKVIQKSKLSASLTNGIVDEVRR